MDFAVKFSLAIRITQALLAVLILSILAYGAYSPLFHSFSPALLYPNDR
jgi:hypothetical protein